MSYQYGERRNLVAVKHELGVQQELNCVTLPRAFVIILGPFVGAIVGELMNNKTGKQAIKSGMGSLLWFALGTWLKFVVTGLMLWYGIAAIIN
jgi:uncharacterized protein YqgC (DUF456 family)